MTLDIAELRAALSGFVEPHSGQSLGDSGAIVELGADGNVIKLAVRLGFPCQGYRDELAALLSAELQRQGLRDFSLALELSSHVVAHEVQRGLKPLPGVANIVAVASGKGGVGKSTVAVNLALAWRADGARVGILDADIYGPSQPLMLGLVGERPGSRDGKRIIPLEAHGVRAMSIGFLVEESQAVVWRGPMVTQALTQLLGDTEWGELDYLVVDIPPGTGDIQLTLAQRVPVAGAVVVTTPQDIALSDARRGISMFEKVNVPVLGVVENMSLYRCSQCGHVEHIFGQGGAAELAGEVGVRLLGELPLDVAIRREADSGQPSVVADPGSARARAFTAFARNAAGELSRRRKDSAGAFPKIVVEEKR